MPNNIVTSSDVNKPKQEKPKAVETVEDSVVEKPVKKAAKPKATSKVDNGKQLVVFESGASYNSNGVRFTRENNMQEVESDFANFLLTLENFRLPTSFEIEEYFASKED